MLHQVCLAAFAPHLEIIGAGPFRERLDLMPAIKHFDDFQPSAVPKKAARFFVGLEPRTAFYFDCVQPHGPETNRQRIGRCVNPVSRRRVGQGPNQIIANGRTATR